jgi:uncharacterized spore protein YtfJ
MLAGEPATEVGMDIGGLLAKAGDNIHAGRAFGEPVVREGCTVLPCAFVLGAGGAGGGRGTDARGAPGEGGGGGHLSVSWPVGAYVITGGDVRWVPALDVTRLVLAGLAFVKVAPRLRRRRGRRQRTGTAAQLAGSAGVAVKS